MLSRKAITINGLRAVLDAAQVARVGELACIDTATGQFKSATAGLATLRPFGTFTENLTGDGTRQTYVAGFNELRCTEWLNDTVDPVVMPTHRGSVVYMKDGATVTSDSGSGANAPAGVALDIDAGGRVIVQPPVGPGGAAASSAGSSPTLVFADFGAQAPSLGRYTVWGDFVAALAAIPLGSAPIITLALQTGPFVVPLAGMPVTGWDFRGGTIRGASPAIGSIVLDCPPGVKLDNLAGSEWLIIKIAPPAGTGVCEFTATLPGAGRIHFVRGGYVDHTAAPGAFIRSPGTVPGGDTTVLASFEANWFQHPGPLAGPLVFLSNDGGQEDDGAVLVQIGCLGGLPSGALANNNAAPSLILIRDSTANPDTTSLPLFAPGYSGAVSFDFTADTAKMVPYDDAIIVPPLGATTVQGAIDALKLASGGSGVADRRNHSVNGASIEHYAAPSGTTGPILRTNTNVNPAGGYTGGGTGNKAILGHRLSAPLLVSALSTIEFSVEHLTPEVGVAGNAIPFVNLVVELDPTGPHAGIYTIFSMMSRDFPLLNLGAFVDAPPIYTVTWDAALHYAQVVSDRGLYRSSLPLPAWDPPFPAAGPPGQFVVPAVGVGGDPPAGSWTSRAYTMASILAFYPSARIVNANSLDGGTPKLTITAGLMLALGDSANVKQNAVRLLDFKLNGVAV